jgi:hypothetical protein
MSTPSTISTLPNHETNVFRGEILDVLRVLLEEGRSEDVLDLFCKLVARNSELEKRLSELLSRGKSEKGSPAHSCNYF